MIRSSSVSCYSVVFISRDGRTGEPLPAAEVWKAWTILACQLADDEELSPGKRALCRQVHEAVRGAVLETRRASKRS